MAKAVKEVKKKRAPANKMPEPLPAGLILEDLSKKEWKLGPSIGKGGFGEIYSAQEANKSSSTYPYVIKIESHSNGTLFVEMHFYMRNAKPSDIENFRTKHKLATFGMPAFWGSGSHTYSGTKYRFIVMDKFGDDIQKLFQRYGDVFPASTVFQLAMQLTYVLEYIHEFGYVHADLKGSNILMGATPKNKNQAYLVDFGLATKFSTDQEFKPNPKKAHDGTIEFLSRDAHKGVPTRRGDLEILAYNVIYWLGCRLPWMGKKDPNLVHQAKEEAMSDPNKFLKKCFGDQTIPDGVLKFLKYVNGLQFNEAPNYDEIRKMFVAEIKAAGASPNGMLSFAPKKTPVKRRSISKSGSTPVKQTRKNPTARKKPHMEEAEDDENIKEQTNGLSATSLPAQIEDEVCSEEPPREKKPKKKNKKDEKDAQHEKQAVPSDSLQNGDDNMTAAMKEILAKRADKAKNGTKKPAKRTAAKSTVNDKDSEDKITKSSPVRNENEEERRLRHRLKVVNYDERTPKTERRTRK